ncbi:MAG TPA: cobyric acid synthase [Candidatus Fimadaptatus faecigallinarum]|uniref:Cobyric acid synthase n=1 Tax=Candidatus Fimadaptatus faecigallinarum TaxID=2840814 RepID=A0A9D1LPI4_9FIRM|nr:cobyric acid synthase [Candidatus Fimadaptatus faecigallinarum]
MRGKSLMIQGTGSSVGKSVLCAALLRIMKQDGFSVAPFKAQNMALNSYATREGLEMGRAQVTQAQAAGIEPSVRMNPVLLKPTSDRRSQVIVNGRPLGSMTAMEYHNYKPKLRRMVKQTYDELERGVDFVVLEGAGSPAEINLREGDIVNMSMAKAADAPVILVGDINLGGVFASLLGTVMLLEDDERARVKGVIINKFRGDVKILEPGLRMLEERIGVPVLGVVPWMDVELEDEDSVTERLGSVSGSGDIDVAVVRLGHISNFSDFQALTLAGGAKVRYVTSARELEGADVIILPGTKNTIEDLLELRARGIDAAIVRHARAGGLVVGVCGGYQMLGNRLCDPHHVESRVPEVAGLGLLDMDVVFRDEKTTVQATGEIRAETGWLAKLNGVNVDGYEIHAGVNEFHSESRPWLYVRGEVDGVTNPQGNVIGSYVHGLFDNGALWRALRDQVRARRGLDAQDGETLTMDEYREREFDRIAAIVRASVDMERIYRIARGEE